MIAVASWPTPLAHALPYVGVSCLSLLLRSLVPVSQRGWNRFAREFLLLTPFVLMYFAARGLAAQRPTLAFAHAQTVIDVERRLGIFRELQWQQTLLNRKWGIEAVNWIYIWGHWPFIIGTFIWLGSKHPDALPRYRNAFILSGALGFAIFLFYPVAPPRFLSSLGFVDTISLHSRAYRVLQPPSLEDLFASMPSLHAGWNLLMGIALVRESRSLAPRMLGVALPTVMVAAVILTANHYILDVLVGAVIVLASFWISGVYQNAQRSR